MSNPKNLLLSLSFLLAISLFSINSYGQGLCRIQGTVIDSTFTTNKLENTRILILNAKDSILIAHTRTKADGSFMIDQVRDGSFILLATYPGYADYVDRFVINGLKLHDFGKLYLTSKAMLLKEVVIKGRSAVTLKGDTIEYNAEHYVIQPNSKVEDLLKQFAGIEIDKDGKIRAQGQIVNKILVDGEEFFGDDPTLVTRNIRGDMVDKIQLFDKKSDQATLTGINDGKDTKTINVVLKEDSKIGIFGIVNAGKALNKLYEAKGMVNVFKEASKFAAYGNIATTGKTGPDFLEGNRFGTVPLSVSTVNGVTGFFDELEGTGIYNGIGYPLAKTSGSHYDSKWNADKQSVNANYRIGSLETNGSESIRSQNIIFGNITNTSKENKFGNYTFRQKGDVVFETELAPSSILKVSIDATLKKINNLTESSELRSLENGSLLTTQQNKLASDGNQNAVNMSISWSKKFKRPGRALLLSINPTFSSRKISGLQNSNITYYNTASSIDSAQNIDRSQIRNNHNTDIHTSLSYSEALSKELAIFFNTNFDTDHSTLNRDTYNKAASGQYDALVDDLSDKLEYSQISAQGGIILNYRRKKGIANLGLNLNNVQFYQTDLVSDQKYNRSYLNFNPQFNYQYSFSKQQALKLAYTGNTIRPTIDQLQPLRIIDDPLNIVVGNPNLKPAFNHSINIRYNNYKPLNNQTIYITGTYALRSNPFGLNYMSDAAGNTIIQTVNVADNSNTDITFLGDLSRKFTPQDLQVGMHMDASYAKNYDYINSSLNVNTYRTVGAGIKVSKYKSKKYSATAKFDASFSKNVQSIQNLSDNPITLKTNVDCTIYLPGKVEVHADASYINTSSIYMSDTSIDPIILNASITKSFLKEENLNFSISGNNLLNQNPGYIRRPNYQSLYSTIRRYILLSINWDFSRMGTSK